jgi:hypothetical protein
MDIPQECVEAMQKLHTNLKDDYDVEVIMNRIYRTIGALRVKIPDNSLLHEKYPEAESVSVIIPMDTYWGCKYLVYETALFGGDGVVYNEELGYSDVCRFSNPSEVNQELERLGLRNK